MINNEDIEQKNGNMHPKLVLYDLSNYNFDQKEPQHEKDRSVPERLNRMKNMYLKYGARRSVDAILLVHQHKHPHVLLLQIGNNLRGFFKLPGGRCRPEEGELECLSRKLIKRLAPKGATYEWTVGDCLATWYRPNHETMLYPYLPPHIKRPKEVKKLYIVPLPEKSFFSVPKNFNFVAVPLFELYDNHKRYGPIISCVPQLLSKYKFVYK